ncbi:OmcA/MtrC family decaheme c-type cytochrome [Shewanella eurypsychrophilus]|uniref:OmcA/MtrC family decaheme c-type cytochrome n=1 Tax=Shewanella eurypsychrophilus TaxID=2593656 RepID=A0ABX6V1H7_9GAMM|nr:MULTISPECIES: OmcA/MtrC family decaheme c-type cytochrome [Shewanella]QFU20570.1 OmcA/MtrC family decaheme c-type cytochrome [Shewanella sp. YLB-09]QFU20851.1 OmcA/MtrC family decaheme c-type cytochrome [Shewanella sp. YLB-09]QPG56139.1 OmcA/MtrC family decaheme c-type cytochrome [Shewanella eurypsychrophilus]
MMIIKTTHARRFSYFALSAAVALTTLGCSDGKDGTDGKPGNPGGIVSTQAEVLTLNITNSEIVNQQLSLDFTAYNEKQLPVVKIAAIKLDTAQLLPEFEGERSQWQTLSSEYCTPEKGCEGILVDNMDGSYRYTMSGPLVGQDVEFNSEWTQRVTLRVEESAQVPQSYTHNDFNLDGSEITNNRAIVDASNCLKCHDSIESIKHGGDELENCASCHTSNNMSDPSKVWPVLAHSVHIGVTSEPIGNCVSCHEGEESESLQQALNWNQVPTRETCSSCHDMTSNEVYDHSGQESNGQCLTCHAPEQTYDDHLSKYEKAIDEQQRGIVTVDVRDAKLVEQDGEHFAEISFALLNKQGEAIAVANNNPADAEWIKNLQMYVNWGTSVDFTTSRGYTIYVKSNKKDITQDGSGITPAGERARTPLHSSSDNVFTYLMGPVVTQDSISGDLIDDAGFISNRLIYCFAPDQSLMSCDESGHAKNASMNERWFFNRDGLTEDPSEARPVIVSNEKCGSCHGFDEFSQNTELACRSCHSRKTEMNKKHADTTCFSGHDHDELGNHIEPFAERAMLPTGKSGFISSTADIIDPCLACHNPNTPPTQAIREMHTKPSDWDYVEQLTVTHPDHKVWMHSLHTNQRATQDTVNGVRNVDYPADKANCYRCHEGDTFGVERLTSQGRPLALDLDYDPDSTAHPATDITIDAYTSPVSATCYACHAKQENAEGEMVINKAVRAHMEQNGGRFGVTENELQVESCAVCHSIENLKQVHKL